MKRNLIIVLAFSVILGAVILVLSIVKDKENLENIQRQLDNVELQKAEVLEYIVYGTHLNLKGAIIKEAEEIKDVNLVLAGEDGKKQVLDLDYKQEDNKIEFWTSDVLNEGIDLECLETNNYIVLLEFNGKGSSKSKLYLLENKTDYSDIRYYTITKDKKNKKIDIQFVNGYMDINVVKSRLPKEVYDIVIDPGHGGSDKGAKGSGYDEADLNLEYGKKVKSELEKLGLKVKITRDGTEAEESFGRNTVYAENGRINIVRKFKGKICIFNSFK